MFHILKRHCVSTFINRRWQMRCPSVCLFVCMVCLFVRLSVIVKLFATWQHPTSSGGFSYRLRYTFLYSLNFLVCASEQNKDALNVVVALLVRRSLR